jgi:hypothetical protein
MFSLSPNCFCCPQSITNFPALGELIAVQVIDDVWARIKLCQIQSLDQAGLKRQPLNWKLRSKNFGPK